MEMGISEIICGTHYGSGSRVVVLDNDLEAKWVSSPWRGLRTTGFERQDMFSMTLVATGDVLANSPGSEVVAVTQGGVGVYSAAGEAPRHCPRADRLHGCRNRRADRLPRLQPQRGRYHLLHRYDGRLAAGNQRPHSAGFGKGNRGQPGRDSDAGRPLFSKTLGGRKVRHPLEFLFPHAGAESPRIAGVVSRTLPVREH